MPTSPAHARYLGRFLRLRHAAIALAVVMPAGAAVALRHVPLSPFAVACLGLAMLALLGTVFALVDGDRRTLDAAATEHARFSALAAHSDHAVLVTDASGAVAWVNDGYVRLSGRAAARAVGRPLAELFTPLPLALRQALRHRESFRDLVSIPAHGGATRTLLVEARPLEPAPAGPGGHILLGVDLTAYRDADAQLHLAHRRLAAATEAGLVGLFEWSVGASEVWLDPVARRLLGLEESAGTVPLQQFEACVHPSDQGAVAAGWQRALRDQGELRLAFRTPVSGAAPRHLSLRGLFDLDADYRPLRLTGVLLDESRAVQAREQLRTEKQRAEAALRRVSSLHQALDAHAHVVITDPQGLITYVNDRYCAASGHERMQLIGRSVALESAEPDADARYAAIRAEAADGRPWHGELANRARDGRPYWVDATTVPFRSADGALEQLISIRTDITERRLAEDAAEAASRAKGEFLANMSHELRTPLNGVIGMTGLLLETPLGPEQREYAEIARSSGESLLALINDVLDLSKIESGCLELEHIDFDLRSVVEEAVDAVALRAAEKRLELLVDIDPTCPTSVRGDPTRLRQVFLNLLSNAVKFTARGEVLVTLVPAPAPEGRLGILASVRDTGIGIASEQVERLFRPFIQADASTSRRFGGSGLGLSICQRLVQAMDGHIEVTSTPGAGSTFTVRVLLAPSALPEPQPRSGRRVQALLVDDHPVNRRILGTQLEAAGFRVESATTAEEGLAAWRRAHEAQRTPEVAILDHRLPGEDGAWLAGEIRRLDPGGRTRLVLLSSLATRIDPASGARFDRLLTKPVKRDALVRVLGEVLGESPAATPAAAPVAAALQGRRVLLAEDNPVNQKLALRLLQRLGLEVTLARNGREALERLRGARFEVVLMDCQMPELDGYAATRALREGAAGETNRGVPVIAVTAHALAGDRDECLAAGMTDYLPKPVELARLRQALERALGAAPATPAAPGAVADVVDLLDTDELSRHLDHDQPFIAELLGAFLDSAGALVAELERDRDLAARRRLAHALKGSSVNVRARRLARAAAALERCEEAAAPGLIAEVSGAWQATRHAVLLRLGRDGASLAATG